MRQEIVSLIICLRFVQSRISERWIDRFARDLSTHDEHPTTTLDALLAANRTAFRVECAGRDTHFEDVDRRIFIGRNVRLIGLGVAASIAGCGGGQEWEACDAIDPQDFIYGDRCAAALPDDGKIETSIQVVRLHPSSDGAPQTERFSVIGYTTGKNENEDEAKAKSPADGYIIDLQIRGEEEDGECSLDLSLAPASEAEFCVVDTEDRLRCLLDPTGVAEIDVMTTLDHPTRSRCTIEVNSGLADTVEVEVAVNYDIDELDLEINLGAADCVDASSPCTPKGGVLPASVCSTSGEQSCGGLTGGVAFYLAVERDGVDVPLEEPLGLDLQSVAQQYPAGFVSASSSPDCSDEVSSATVLASGRSTTMYWCSDGRPGLYELMAVGGDTRLSSSIVVSFPSIPARIFSKPEGDEHKLVVEDCDGQVLEEPLQVTMGDGSVSDVISGSSISVADGVEEIDVSFKEWGRACSVALGTP